MFEESFIFVFPKDFREPLDLVGVPSSLPFIRFSRLTGTGQQIERQIVRMKLKLPQMVEVESSHQQLGIGGGRARLDDYHAGLSGGSAGAVATVKGRADDAWPFFARGSGGRTH